MYAVGARCVVCAWCAGEDEVEQLLCIMEIMGVPAPHLVDAASRKKVFFDASGQPSVVPNSRGECHLGCGVHGDFSGVLREV